MLYAGWVERRILSSRLVRGCKGHEVTLVCSGMHRTYLLAFNAF